MSSSETVEHNKTTSVAIIGAGISGLSCAYFLNQHGGKTSEGKPRFQVEILESDERIGGHTATKMVECDGQKLAITLSKDSEDQEIYIQDVRTKELTRFTRSPYIDTEANWAADGKSIIFTSDRSSGPQIYQQSLASGRPERLTFVGSYNAGARITPDGRAIVYIHRDENSQYHVAYQEIASGDRIILSSETTLDERPTIAPNGAMLMYGTKDRNGKGVLAVVSMDAGVKYHLPSKQGDVREPAWQPYRP